MRESPDAPSFSSLPDPFEAYRPRLLLGISAGAAAGLMVVATATGVFRGPLAGLEWAGFWVALALFCAAPLMQRWTSSVLVGVSLLLAGGAVSIFVPAYFAGGLRAPQVIWLLVVPMLAPFYFGFRVTLVSGVLSLAAFTLLFALGLSGALPVASPDTTGFHTFMNLALAIVFVMAVSISTHRAMRQNSQSLLSLKEEIERRSEELAESESRKSAILDSAVAGLISTDADARVVEFNPAASQILGYTREEAIGQKLVDFLIPNSLRDAHSSAYQRAVEHPSPQCPQSRDNWSHSVPTERRFRSKSCCSGFLSRDLRSSWHSSATCAQSGEPRRWCAGASSSYTGPSVSRAWAVLLEAWRTTSTTCSWSSAATARA
ncbi:MAG: PAS domain S-box protein [Myxococcota bacterium]